jgi:sodium pump decarboxylase gamma subunit
MNNLSIGLQLTVIGMGLVFLLLALLAVLIVVLLRLDGRKTARPAQGQPSATLAEASDAATALTAQDSVTVTPVARSAGATGELSPEMLAAVMVAVRMHRRIRRKQAAPAMRLHQPGTLPSRWVGAGRTSQNQNWQPGRR